MTAILMREKIRVEQWLRSLMGPKVMVELTQNRSTVISFRRRNGVTYVRAHALFGAAGEEVLNAVAQYVAGKPSHTQRALIDQFIHQNRQEIRLPKDQPLSVQPFGEVHDLQASLDRLNQQHFEGGINTRISWSKAPRNRRRRSIRMGSYSPDQNLIRIHPALDQVFVPLYLVDSVVFHEMLHALYGIKHTAEGRRCIHSKEFLLHERLFPDYAAARLWENEHIHRLLKY